jgi:hypothetical protein
MLKNATSRQCAIGRRPRSLFDDHTIFGAAISPGLATNRLQLDTQKDSIVYAYKADQRLRRAQNVDDLILG